MPVKGIRWKSAGSQCSCPFNPIKLRRKLKTLEPDFDSTLKGTFRFHTVLLIAFNLERSLMTAASGKNRDLITKPDVTVLPVSLLLAP